MFSPYYAWRGRGDPLDHCSLNVALYGPGWSRWSMTERSKSAVRRGADLYEVGPSALRWEGDSLLVSIEEISVPFLTRLSGTVRLTPHAMLDTAYALDSNSAHWWRPIAPTARIEVKMDRPDFRWSGNGYLDMNWGERPLENDFVRWDWSRTDLRKGSAVLYDATRRDGTDLSLGLRFDGRGATEDFAPPPRHSLRRTLWRMDRAIQSEGDAPPQHLKTLEDSPFYARSEIGSRLLGEDVRAMHESLDLDRFSARWVKALLPWRMPRRIF